MAKKLTLYAIAVMAALGVLVMFMPFVDMGRFKTLCDALSPFIVTLMVSIGGNSAIQKFLDRN